MIYLYSRKNHPSLAYLADALGSERLYRFDGESFWDRKGRGRIYIPAGSTIVPWGEDLPEMEDLRVLNGLEKSYNKLEEYNLLTKSNIASVKAYHENLNDHDSWQRGPGAYIPRKFGEPISLDGSVANPDYYVTRQTFVNEYVIHSFAGKSIRAGVKVTKPGYPLAMSDLQWSLNPSSSAHPWIKIGPTGWTTDYTFTSTPTIRSLAHRAVKALGLTFAEVSIGMTDTGTSYVISVNKAPDLTGTNAIMAYKRAIQKWGQAELEVPYANL